MNIDNYKKVLAKNLKIERLKGNLKQVQLSIMSGVSLDTIRKIEQSTANPTLETLVAIALALKVDLNTLLPLK